MTTLSERIQEILDSGFTQAELYRAAGVSKGTPNQWLNGGIKSMKLEYAQGIQALTGFKADWIVTGGGRKKVEAHPGSNVAPGPQMREMIPLISWVRAGAFCESSDNFEPGDAERWLPCPVQHGPRTFALQVIGLSMYREDGYLEGEYIFVDPDQRDPIPNKDFIFKLADHSSTFKRLKQELDGWYLEALNPDWEPRYQKIPEDAHICGRIIWSMRDR